MHITSYIILFSSIAIIQPVNYENPSIHCIQLIEEIAKQMNIYDYLHEKWCWQRTGDSAGSGSGDESGSGIWDGYSYGRTTCNFQCDSCKYIATEIYNTLIGTINTEYGYEDVYRKCIAITEPSYTTSTTTTDMPDTEPVADIHQDKSGLQIAVYSITGGLLTSGAVGICLVCRLQKHNMALKIPKI